MDGDLLIANLAGYLRANAAKFLDSPQAGIALSNGKLHASSLHSDSNAPVLKESPRLFRRQSHAQPQKPKGTELRDDGCELRPTFALDYHHLYFLHRKFSELGYLDEESSGGTKAAGTEHGFEKRKTSSRTSSSSSSSIRSSHSQPSVASNFTRYFGFGRKKRFSGSHAVGRLPEVASTERERDVDEDEDDALFILRFLQSLTCIRIGPFGKQKLSGYELPPDTTVPLTCFKNLKRLELVKVSPAMFSHWSSISVHLERIACTEISVVDLADLFGDILDSIEARNDGVGDERKSTSWTKLHHLDVSNNQISSVTFEPLSKIVECRDFCLSRNSLTETPSSLATLYNLRRLDLSYNLISTVQEIHRSLGNIVHLNLRGNKIQQLSGVDRLWALVDCDIRDNQIAHVDEIHRLANLPEIKTISVRGNPLESNIDYRTEIFSGFLKRGLEIFLDGIGATDFQRQKISKAHIQPVAVLNAVDTCAATGGKSGGDAESQSGHQFETASDTLSLNASIRKRRKAKRVVTIEGCDDIMEGSEIIRPVSVLKKNAKKKGRNFSSGIDEEDTGGRDRRKAKNRGVDDAVGRHVHRLVGLQDILTTASGTAGDPAADATRPQARPVSDGSDELTQTKSSTDDFRRRIEAMRLESGESWLKVFAEREQREDKNDEKKIISLARIGRVENDENDQERMKHPPISTSLQFPAFEFSRGATIRPLDSPESVRSQRHKQGDRDNDDTETTGDGVPPMIEKATIGSECSTTMQSVSKEAEGEGDHSSSDEIQRALPLPKGKLFLVDSYSYESGLDWGRGTRSRRLPGVKRHLLLTETEILEINAEGGKEAEMLSMEDVAIGRPLSALLRVDGVSGSPALGRLLELQKNKGSNSVRLAFCTTRYDPLVKCDYSASEGLDELRTLLISKAKANWERGHADDVLKKGKCLGCGWIGFLADEDGESWGGEEDGLEFAEGTKGGDLDMIDRKCGRCGGTFLAEFYGPDADSKGGAATTADVPFGGVAGNMASSFLGEAKNLFDMFRVPSVLSFSPGLAGLSTEGFFGGSKATPANEAGPGSKDHTNRSRSSIRSMTMSKRLERFVRSLPHGSAVGLPPFRTAGNPLLLHLKLNIFTSDAERLLAWLPTSWVPHGSAFTPVAWKWSLMAASTANQPIGPPYCPVESPVYIALSNRAIYLFTPNLTSTAPAIHLRREARIFSEAEVIKAEQEPDQYLRLLHTVPLSSVARIDCGPNRQAITFHFALTPLDDTGIPLTSTVVSAAASSHPPENVLAAGSSSVMGSQVVPVGRLGPPSTSCTFLVRDRLSCSDFLNHLLVLCYDTGLHLFDNKVKLVSHDIEWAVRNVRDQAFIGEFESNDTGLDVDPASEADVVIDKVSFEFIKMVYGIGFLTGGHVEETRLDGTVTATSKEAIAITPTTRH